MTAAWEIAPQIAWETAPKRQGEGKGEYRCDFGEGRIHAIKHIFFQISASLMKLSASPEKQSSPCIILVFF